MRIKKRIIAPIFIMAGLFFGPSFIKYFLLPFDPKAGIPQGLNVSFLDTSLGIDAHSSIEEDVEQNQTTTYVKEE